MIDIPIDVKACLAHKVKLPKGDWTAEQIANVVASYQAREDQLEGCLVDVVSWYRDYARRLAAKR